MKRIICIFAIFIVFLCTSCRGNTNCNENISGEWVAVCGEYENMPLSGDEIKNYTIELKKSGKVTVCCNDEKYKGKWGNDDERLTIKLKNKQLNAKIENNILIFEDFLKKDFKLTFVLKGTKECNPELYMSDEAKKMLGSWKTTKMYDVMGNEIPAEKKQNLKLTFYSDYTVDICFENQNYKKQNWYVSKKYGGLKNSDYDISWEFCDDELDVIVLVNGEYIIFKCEKQKN